MKKATFSVAVCRPFRLDLTAMVMRRRTQNTISSWDGHAFQRILAIGDTPVRVTATQGGTENSPQLLMLLESLSDLDFDQQVEAQLMTQKMLGVTVDLKSFNGQVSRDPVVWKMVGQNLGVKPTRFPTVFEALISAVVCQQTKYLTTIQRLNGISEQYGLAFADNEKVMHAFPRPEDLATATDPALRQLGIDSETARIIMRLTNGVVRGTFNLDQLEIATKDEAYAHLTSLPGVSRWAAEYIMVRGLGMLDVFPADDIRAAGILQRVMGLKVKPDYEQVQMLTTSWHPYEGFVYFHLLLERLRSMGVVQ